MSTAIDVYQQYNDVTDWHAVKASGVGYAWVKLTDGRGPATVRGDAYVAAARGAGIAVGGYHYAHGAQTPEVQAQVLAGELIRLDVLDIAPMLDLEDGTIRYPENFRTRFWQQFLQILPVSRVATYANEYWWKTFLSPTLVVPNELIWIASYGPNDGTDHGCTIPFDIHQYTSVGSVPGIVGPVDLSTVVSHVEIGARDMGVQNSILEPGENRKVKLIVPVGTASAITARAWLSLACADDSSKILGVDGWSSAASPVGTFGSGPFTLTPDNRWVVEIVSGTDSITIGYTSDVPITVCIETLGK